MAININVYAEPREVSVMFAGESASLMDNVRRFSVRKTGTGFELDLFRNETEGDLKSPKQREPAINSQGFVGEYFPHLKFVQVKWLGQRLTPVRLKDAPHRVLSNTADKVTIAIDVKLAGLVGRKPHKKSGRPVTLSKPLTRTADAPPVMPAKISKSSNAVYSIPASMVPKMMQDGARVVEWKGAKAEVIEHEGENYRVL